MASVKACGINFKTLFKNLDNGKVHISWDRSLKTDDAKVLLRWSGGTTAQEVNDWTLDPFELVIK
jgi:hypothetical protein